MRLTPAPSLAAFDSRGLSVKITLLAVGTRLPAWAEDGVENYRRRLPAQLNFQIEEIPLGSRKARDDVKQSVRIEGEALLRRLDSADLVVALDERGQQWSSRETANHLAEWQSHSLRVALMVGGPDGLAKGCLERAREIWSLSRLTLPHALVRVMVVEQVYRAWTLLQGHPYHRS